ncbi:unnamed protein product [Rotaria sordida]|uniref:DM2 domain-containing protein n=1 Tax=Rotaria sordida TaxID=392033 RepID=A0A813RYR9_9BILA|nr:unnamed protein product [Rotaria sordida]CAF0792166.1 unnamed protein product [Rotaria sordida]CAF0862427.1 unnamed protein product [Rotaria sordida]CAF0866551.1 unnamed protein product [Rotaria sordida]CAF0870407.1 unnamed protein product [Rotaria sordida]
MASISADKLRREIQIILKDADLNTLSSKKVRQMLEAVFNCDFTERKKEIDDILMAEITTRDAMPIPTNVEQNSMNDDIQRLDDNSQTKTMQIQSNNDNNQQTNKSDEELAMEIHQQENRPSLRRTVSATSTTTIYKKPTTPSLKVERRRTCYNKELDLSDQLAAVVGGHQMPRSEVVKRMWVYFKEHNLLDPINKQYVNCDETLAKLFGRRRVRAFGMLKGLSRHMSDPDKQE